MLHRSTQSWVQPCGTPGMGGGQYRWYLHTLKAILSSIEVCQFHMVHRYHSWVWPCGTPGMVGSTVDTYIYYHRVSSPH